QEMLRQHRVPCAQSAVLSSAGEGQPLAGRVGYPFIVKPLAGSGALGTTLVDDEDQLVAVLPEMGVARGASVAVEQFVTGHVGFYDTLTVGGHVVHEFFCHYYPNVLEAMRARRVSPQIVVTDRADAPGYAELKDMGRRV